MTYCPGCERMEDACTCSPDLVTIPADWPTHELVATLRAENERLRAELQAARMPDEVRATIGEIRRLVWSYMGVSVAKPFTDWLDGLDAQRKGGE